MTTETAPAVEIRDTEGVGCRMLVVGNPYITAVQFPANQYRSEEWLIVAQLGMPAATVHSEEDARAWLEFLARNLA